MKKRDNRNKKKSSLNKVEPVNKKTQITFALSMNNCSIGI